MDGGACDGRLGKALAKGRDMEFGQWVPGLSPHDTLGQLGARPGYKEGAKNHHILLEGLSLPANAAYAGLIPGLGRLPWRRKWLPTPVVRPREFHRQRSLAGSSPWGGKESDTTERLALHSLAGISKHIIFTFLNKDTLSVFCDTYKGSLV